MGRTNRVPSYDLARHIITGEQVPLSGDGIVRDVDNAAIDYDDPMQFRGVPGLSEGNEYPTIEAINLSGSQGLDSAAADGEPVSMDMGDWAWDYSDIVPSVWKTAREVMRRRMISWYRKGVIRYGRIW